MTQLENLLKKIFYSSLSGIIANSASANPPNSVRSPLVDQFNPSHEATNIAVKPKLVLKLVGGSEWKFTNHRSHRSHSSHRSHASHYSSRSSGSSVGSSPSSPNQSILQPYHESYQLGSRILRLGMKGNDVTELINILLMRKYLRLGEDTTGTARVSGEYTFDKTIEDAVKRFQTDNNLTSDGIVNSITVYYLKKQ